MKNIIIILIPVVLPFVLQAQEKDTQPRFTEFRTDTESANSEWNCKITDEKELHNYMLQLVTSKEKSDNDIQYCCVQVLDKTTGQPVQEIDLDDYPGPGWQEDFSHFYDYNFDGYNDFSLSGQIYAMGNTTAHYFLFDPETGTFFDSGFAGTDLTFDSDTKTITTQNRCCAGASIMHQTFKLVDNKMILLEERNLQAVRDEAGDVLFDREGNLIFEETDGSNPYVNLQLQSVGLKNNFRLRLAIYDEDMAGGFVLYSGQTERIPVHFDRQEIAEDRSEEGRPNVMDLFYNEMYRGEINGVYVLTVQGARFYNAKYIRKKDGKTFQLDILSDL